MLTDPNPDDPLVPEIAHVSIPIIQESLFDDRTDIQD